MQFIPLKVPGKFLIDKLRSLLAKEADYNLLAKYLINILLIPRGESSVPIPEEDFDSRKDHRSAEVA